MNWRDSIAPNQSGWVTLQNGDSDVDVWVCRAAQPTATSFLVCAGVHGDEYEGPAALWALTEQLKPEDLACDLAIVPVANRPAYAAATRLTPTDGKNLARSFPGKRDGTDSERLAALLWNHLVIGLDGLIDLHSGGVRYNFLPVAGFYGQPTSDNSSFQAARAFGLPHLWQLPNTDGVLSSEANRIGIPTTGCEYGGAGQLDRAGKRAYCEGVLSCLRQWGGLVSQDVAAGMPAQTALTGDWQLASSTGTFEAYAALGAQVNPGDQIATIKGERGETLESFISPVSGVVLALRSLAMISPGEWAVLLGKPIWHSKGTDDREVA